MNFSSGFTTDIGLKRSQNQDSALVAEALGLFVVADGMGGHKGGEIASQMAVDAISAQVEATENLPEWEPRLTLFRAIQSANASIFRRSCKEIQLQGMGTTVTALLFRERQMVIGHVGDSRCYLIRPHQIWQLTRDHSLVQEKLRVGIITRREAQNAAMKNVLTRSVGYESEVQIDCYQMEVQPKDCFLICSDGLTGLVEDNEILEKVQAPAFEGGRLQEATDELVQAANRRGGDDNITCILVQVP